MGVTGNEGIIVLHNGDALKNILMELRYVLVALFVSSVQHVRILLKQLRDPRRRGGAGGKLRVLVQQRVRRCLGLLKQPGVAAQIRNFQPR